MCDSTVDTCVLWGVSLSLLITSAVVIVLAILAPYVMYLLFATVSLILERYNRLVWGDYIRVLMFKWTTWLFRTGFFWLAFYILQIPENVWSVLEVFFKIPFIVVWFLFTNALFDTITAIVGYEYKKKIDEATSVERKKKYYTVSVASEEGIRILKYVGFIFVFVISVGILFGSTLDLNSFLQSSGVITLIIVFALQPWMRNLFGGVFVFADSQFTLNDTVMISGVVGQVENITLRTTTVRRHDNALVYLPNSWTMEEPVANFSNRKKRLLTVRFRVAPDTPVAKLKQLIKILEGTMQTLHPTIMSHMRNLQLDGDEPDGAVKGDPGNAFFVVLDSMYEILIWTYTFGDALDEKTHAQIQTEVVLAAKEAMEGLGVVSTGTSFSHEEIPQIGSSRTFPMQSNSGVGRRTSSGLPIDSEEGVFFMGSVG